MRRLLTTATLTASMLVLLAVPAFAHASFDVTQLPVGESVDFSLRVPLEREAGNSAIAVLVTTGWTVGECPAADGWECDVRVEDDGDSVISLTRTDDDAGETERFAVTLTAPDTEGVYAFPVVQTYDDGTEVAWIEEPGSDHPAPRIQVGDSTTTVEREDELPTHDAGVEDAPTPDTVGGDTNAPVVSETPADEGTPAPTESDTLDPTDEADEQDAADEADEGSGLPVAVIIVLLLLLVGGGAAAVKARSTD